MWKPIVSDFRSWHTYAQRLLERRRWDLLSYIGIQHRKMIHFLFISLRQLYPSLAPGSIKCAQINFILVQLQFDFYCLSFCLSFSLWSHLIENHQTRTSWGWCAFLAMEVGSWPHSCYFFLFCFFFRSHQPSAGCAAPFRCFQAEAWEGKCFSTL